MPISLQLPVGGRCFHQSPAQATRHHRCCQPIARAATLESSAPTAPDYGQLNEFKQQVVQEWTERAETYDETDTYHDGMARQLVASANIQPGQTVLDVATGTGLAAFAAAQAVGPTGRVFGIDLTHAMLSEALKKTDSRAPLNVSWIWEDVETAEFPPETFDHVLCSSGLAYLEDPDSTFKSFRSWLKPGGRITFNSPKESMRPMAEYLKDLIEDVFGASLRYQMNTVEEEQVVHDLCQATGFTSIEVTSLEGEMLLEGFKAQDWAELVWKQLTQDEQYIPMEGDKMAELKHVKQEFLQTVAKDAQSWVRPEGVASPFNSLTCTAVKPQSDSMVQEAQFESVPAEAALQPPVQQEAEEQVVQPQAEEQVQEPVKPVKAAAKTTTRKGRTTKAAAKKQ